jgi:dTDP-4-dehydrorhamnose reductase
MRLLITGASGQLGGYVLRELKGSPREVTAWGHARHGDLFGFPLRPVDLADRDGVATAFRAANPTAVLHLGAMSTVAGCHANPAGAQRVNVDATVQLAELAGAAQARLLFVSTDLVFDGTKAPYAERDAAHPLSVYGRSKRDAEPAVLATPRGIVARGGLMFGPTLIGRSYFFDQQLDKLRAGQLVTWFVDEWRTPLALLAAARALLALLDSDFTGLIHLGGPERMSRYDMGRRLAAFYGLDPAKVVPVERASLAAAEPRPNDVSLDSGLWRSLFPQHWWLTWEEALAAMT